MKNFPASVGCISPVVLTWKKTFVREAFENFRETNWEDCTNLLAINMKSQPAWFFHCQLSEAATAWGSLTQDVCHHPVAAVSVNSHQKQSGRTATNIPSNLLFFSTVSLEIGPQLCSTLSSSINDRMLEEEFCWASSLQPNVPLGVIANVHCSSALSHVQ